MAIKLNSLLDEHNDVVVTFYNGEASLVTKDFTTPFIQGFRQPKIFAELVDDEKQVKVFDFTNSRFRVLKVRNIRYVFPLSRILNNDKVLE